METNASHLSLSFKLRLLLFTVLLTVLTVGFVSSLNSETLFDDNPRVRVAEIEEALSDAEPSIDSDKHAFIALVTTPLQYCSLLNIEHIRGHYITAPVLKRTQFQRNPRAPPAL